MMSLKVLIVDDERLIVWSIRRMLEKEGFVVVTASSVEDAKEFLQAEVFDLIVTDDRMPGLCGRDLIKEVRRQTASKTKCLLMSGSVESDIDGLVTADGFIEKPFLLQELLHKIRELIS